MPLTPGSKVGDYEVVEQIGAGGMGEVYRATDARLDRPVAIKTLPDEVSADRDRLARFEREARMLAQLNHPHIASIYGIEPGPPVALAMELADGETLAHRIQAGPIALDDALLIARQIAQGLEHAHAKAIVHRDLKPANIKIGARGSDPYVKILDFGLAKAMSSDASWSGSAGAVSSPTITSPAELTRPGVVLGTAAYMAPEQARGRGVDHRADIWAFGCVLFEMLTGRRAFDGEDVADVIARVIQSEPQWTRLPGATPAPLRTLLRRCLRKDPNQRLHSIADVRLELEEVASGAAASIDRHAFAPARTMWAAALAGLAVGAAMTGAALLWLEGPAPSVVPAPVLRFSVPAPDGAPFVRTASNGRMTIALSPDGQKLAAVVGSDDSQRRVVVRSLNEDAFREVPGSAGATGIFWAPDNARIGFITPGGELRQAQLGSGGSKPLAILQGAQAAAWSRTNTIVATTSAGALFQWSADGGQPAAIGQPAPGVIARMLPRWLPDSDSFLFVEVRANSPFMLKRHNRGGDTVDVSAFETAGSDIHYQAGHLLLSASDPSGRTVLTAQPLDLNAAKLIGTPRVLATDLNVAFAASDTTLAYGDIRTPQERLVWVDGRGETIAAATDAMERVSNFDLSHDGRLVAIQRANTLLVHDLSRGVTSPLAVRGSDPIWSRDDREVAFAMLSPQMPVGVYAIPAFGGAARLLYESKEGIPYPEDWSPDGQWISAVRRTRGMLIPVGSGREPIMLAAATDSAQDEIKFSPDGQWLVYGEVKPGASEVFLSAMPPTGERWQLSLGGGVQPRWRADGKAVYFLSMTGTLMLVDIALASGVRPVISSPRQVLNTGLVVQPSLDQYALTRDRNRFLVRRAIKDAASRPDQIHIIVNWPTLLKAPVEAR
jgi:eukaryotic-like serine/threonine-protein kinase